MIYLLDGNYVLLIVTGTNDIEESQGFSSFVLLYCLSPSFIYYTYLQFKHTPLIEAAFHGHIDAVKELLSAGATVDLGDKVSSYHCSDLCNEGTLLLYNNLLPRHLISD